MGADRRGRMKPMGSMARENTNKDLSEVFSKKGIKKNPLIKKINLDLPESVIERIDVVADKIGVSRQPLLKIWIFERLQEEQMKSK